MITNNLLIHFHYFHHFHYSGAQGQGGSAGTYHSCHMVKAGNTLDKSVVHHTAT